MKFWALMLVGLATLAWLYALTAILQRVFKALMDSQDLLYQLSQEQHTMATQFANLQQALDTLTATVNKEDTVIDGAAKVILSIPDLITAAVNDALQKGAPPSTLSAFATLNDVINQKGADLAAAIANVPGSGTPPATATIPVIPADGIAQADYQAELIAASFAVGNVTQVDGVPTATPPGDVVSTTPAAGTDAPVGSAVDIQIAQAVPTP